MNKNSNCKCANSPNCNTDVDPCGNKCVDAQNTVALVTKLLSGSYTSQLIEQTGSQILPNAIDLNAEVYQFVAVNLATLDPTKPYFIIPNPAPEYTGIGGVSGSNDLLDSDKFDAAVALPFFLDLTIFAKIIGFVYNQSLDQFIALVGYISDRISCLDLTCCVKDKVINEINKYVDQLLGFSDDGDNTFAARLSQNKFTEFCGAETSVIPLTGPIYVANNVYVAQDNDPAFPPCDNINYVINFLQFVQLKLRVAFSGRCCCDGRHATCTKVCYADICTFVFGRICVIDITIDTCDSTGCEC